MKEKRQKRIIELISQYDIERQEELALYLRKEGFEVTQATISRDIRELRLKKSDNGNGRLVYKLFDGKEYVPDDKYVRILKEAVISTDIAMNLLVIKTVPGMAMAAAAALDACRLYEIVGCIAGDDTIMCALRSVSDAINVKKKIENVIEHA